MEIVSREEELASIHAFIGEVQGGPAVLVLEGDAGIGKTTLWLAGVEHARARGLSVLSSRPAEAERGLANVGLSDLFEDVVDEVLVVLPAPRRRALEVALLLEEESGDPVDHRALGVAVRGALQLLSQRKPVLVAVDDVQWLDPSSSSALAFALRRSDETDVRLLLARRLVDGAQPARRRRRPSRQSACSGCEWDHSASAPSTGFCATGSAGPSRARHCSASTRGRAETRSSR